jgi:glycosyltransferase involved in cell wall biosynthesis
MAVSKQGLEGLKALGIPQAKLRLLYNNADTDRIAKVKPLPAAALRKLGIPAGRPLVLAAGMRRPHKGFDVLLKAAARVKARCHFVLLGDLANAEPAHEALLKRLEQAPELKGRLTVLPAQPDLASWQKASALFVSSSRWEGSPLVVIEAMAAGSAIVATRSGSGEILREGVDAWLCENEDVEGMARAIESGLQSRAERARRGKKAKESALRNFALTVYCRKLMALYDGMLGAPA